MGLADGAAPTTPAAGGERNPNQTRRGVATGPSVT